MARPNAKNKLTEAALQLMVGQGYSATTVDEICEEAGVSKGSFYHFFSTKEDLGVEALGAYYKKGMQVMTGPFLQCEDPVERAYAFLDHTEAVAKDLWSRGCLLGTFAVDLSESHPRIAQQVSGLFNQMEEAISGIFVPFGSEDGNDGRPTAKTIASHFLAVVEGSIVMARAHGDLDLIIRGLRHFRIYLRGLPR